MSEARTYPNSTMWRHKGVVWDKIGEYELHSPPVPDKSEFLNPKTERQRDQKFEHTALPTRDEYESWPKHKQDALAEQEWSRRNNGVWFWNDGVPTWIPGQYYYFLNYHRFGDEKPQYREATRQLYWVWALFVLPHPNCFGLFLHTRRRWGKTSNAASIALEAASGIRNFRVGIQSKTADDAEALFLNEIQVPFQALQECPWFLPQTAGTNKPKRELLFDTPANRKKGAANTPDRLRGLRSKIDWRESTNTAYDSQGLRLFINDEVGKDQTYDPWARHSIVSKQFYPNGPVIGKEIAMTTSDENDDDSVGRCKLFWDNADPAQLDERKGLARLFFADYEGYNVDAYGRNSAEGLADLDKERRAAEAAGPIEWIRRRRAFPRTIEEAHLPSVKADCVFNATHIGDVQTAIAEAFPPPVKRYKLYWVDAAKTKVAATEDANGRFYLPWLPPAEWQNRVQALGEIHTSRGTVTKYKPLQADKFCAGGDPIDMKDPEARASQGAGHGFYRYDLEMEKRRGEWGYWPSHSFVMEYAERPADPDDYYEDLLMYCHWMGCAIFPETNKPGILRYFTARGYYNFLAFPPVDTVTDNNKNQKKPGQASSPLVIGQYVAAQTTYVQRYVGSHQSQDSPDTDHGRNDEGLPYDWRRLPFARTLSQLLSFVPSEQTNRRSHDLAVSMGFTLLNANRYLPQQRPKAAKGLTLAAVGGLTRTMYR